MSDKYKTILDEFKKNLEYSVARLGGHPAICEGYLSNINRLLTECELPDVFRCAGLKDRGYFNERIDEISKEIENSGSALELKANTYNAARMMLLIDDLEPAKEAFVKTLSYIEDSNYEAIEDLDEERAVTLTYSHLDEVDHISFLMKNMDMVKIMIDDAVETYAIGHDIEEDANVLADGFNDVVDSIEARVMDELKK